MAISGKSGGVYIGTNKIAEISTWSLDCEADDVDVTNFDSNGWKEFIAGLKEWSGSFEGNFNPEDTTGQVALINAWINGTTVNLELHFDATKKMAGSALVKPSFEVPVDDKQSISFDFRGTGPLTPTLS